MERLVYVNGEFLPAREAKVSVYDKGFLFGDGVFEGIRAYNGRIFRLDEHLVRLYKSAKAILLNIPLSFEEMRAAVIETVKRNNLKDAYIRLIVTRGIGDLGLDITKCKNPTVVIIADEIALFPKEIYEKGIEVITSSIRASYGDIIPPQIKSLNYLSHILAKWEATRAGVAEAILLSREGYVTEGSAENIFIVKDKCLITPPSWVGILEGITREAVLEIAWDIEEVEDIIEDVFTRYDLYVADECFLCGTAAEVVPVVKVDGRIIGDGKPGPITREIMNRFRELVSKEGVEIYL
ncbi:MAG: branched-chain-amino-acid transaminase [Synergistetes bacterium]|nr:branched-chain-amino-acid transaminase [Synergistota bacterium]MDW8191779.1 branched-chain-amino-acid transaminase [Synergistota bacterium]